VTVTLIHVILSPASRGQLLNPVHVLVNPGHVIVTSDSLGPRLCPDKPYRLPPFEICSEVPDRLLLSLDLSVSSLDCLVLSPNHPISSLDRLVSSLDNFLLLLDLDVALLHAS
jgi:hypothetical protein